ncbi:phage portal protein [Porphyromonas somerae]|uniref:phage portal protein n=1 Tax=Porphyromonas somerae TaxID=322095 RepID=UPI001FCCB19A|nr:phage portal protein [Porphyromonas somerae]BDE81774.1 hypothetical protein CE91St14_08020 [Porphyromonas somerae]
MSFIQGLKRFFGIASNSKSNGKAGGFNISVTNGLAYTNEDALSISSVYRCISAIGNAVGGMTLRCYRRGALGTVEDTTTSLQKLLLVAPNESQTMTEFLSQIMNDVFVFGNALILIRRTGDEVKSLEIADPMVVTVTPSGYVVAGRTYRNKDCIHIRNCYIDRATGMGISTLMHAYDTLKLSKTSDNETSEIISGGGRARGVFTTDDSGLGVGAGATANKKNEVQQIEDELASGRTIAFIPGNLKFIQFAMNPADTQLQEVRRMNVLDICRFFSVHPDKLYANQASNYKASAEAQANFLKDSVFPWCRRISQAFTQKLIDESLWGKFFIDFDYKEALLGDPDGQANLYTKLFNLGSVTVNEVRDVMRLERLTDGDKTLFDTDNIGLIQGQQRKVEE